MRGVLKREWLEIVDTIPAELSLTRYWDTAYQKKKTSDYTVGVKYGMSRDGVGYILHIARTKATPHEVETFIANVAAQDSRSVRIVLQQEPGSGSALWIDSMQRKVLLGYPTYADQVKGSKFERSQPFRAAAEAGHVKLLRGAWNEAFLEECEQFSPDEREYEHDDQVDAACGAFNSQLPTQADDAVYPLAMLEAARAKPDEVLDDGRSPVIVGIDVAGPGKDETAVIVRSGSAIIAHKTWTERDATKLQRAVVEFLERWRGRVQLRQCRRHWNGTLPPHGAEWLRDPGDQLRRGTEEPWPELGHSVRQPKSGNVLARARDPGYRRDQRPRRRDDFPSGAGAVLLRSAGAHCDRVQDQRCQARIGLTGPMGVGRAGVWG